MYWCSLSCLQSDKQLFEKNKWSPDVEMDRTLIRLKTRPFVSLLFRFGQKWHLAVMENTSLSPASYQHVLLFQTNWLKTAFLTHIVHYTCDFMIDNVQILSEKGRVLWPHRSHLAEDKSVYCIAGLKKASLALQMFMGFQQSPKGKSVQQKQIYMSEFVIRESEESCQHPHNR